MWNVFFLVPVGRGQLGDLLAGEEFEAGLRQRSTSCRHRVSFQIKTTEAMHYRRYLLQHNLEERAGAARPSGHAGNVPRRAEYEPGAPQADAQTRNQGWATRRVNDGKGFMFISHMGNVTPAGSFLFMRATSARRRWAIFTAMRRFSKLCATRAGWRASAAPANTRRSAEDRGRGPTP